MRSTSSVFDIHRAYPALPRVQGMVSARRDESGAVVEVVTNPAHGPPRVTVLNPVPTGRAPRRPDIVYPPIAIWYASPYDRDREPPGALPAAR